MPEDPQDQDEFSDMDYATLQKEAGEYEEHPPLNSSADVLRAFLRAPDDYDPEDESEDEEDEEEVETPGYGRYLQPDQDASGYVGVDPMYRNFADDRLKPFDAEEGTAEAEIEEAGKYKIEAEPVRFGVPQG